MVLFRRTTLRTSRATRSLCNSSLRKSRRRFEIGSLRVNRKSLKCRIPNEFCGRQLRHSSKWRALQHQLGEIRRAVRAAGFCCRTKPRIAWGTHIRPPSSAPNSRRRRRFSKAFGTGIGAATGWQDMEIRKKKCGKRFVVLHGGERNCLISRKAKRLLVSISHTENYAAVTAVLEG